MPRDSKHLLDELRAVGEGDDEGSFTLDAPSARAKLERYQLAQPEAWILALVSSAVSAGATAITVKTRAGGWSIRVSARLTLLETLPQVLPDPLGVAHDPEQRAVLDLSSAIHGALAAGAVRVLVESGPTRLEVTASGHRTQTMERALPATRLEISSNWKQTLSRTLRAFGGTDPHQTLLAHRCRQAPLAIQFNGSLLTSSDFHPSRVFMWRRLVAPHDAAAGARLLLVPPRAPYHDERPSPLPLSAIITLSPQSAGCTLLVNGVAYPHRKRHLGISNVTCVAAVPWLELDLSRGEIVENDDYRAVMNMLREQVHDMILQLASDVSQLAPRDQERMLRVFLEEEKRLRGRRARAEGTRDNERERLLHAAGRTLLTFVSVESTAYDRLLDQLHQLYERGQADRSSRLGLTALLERIEEGVLRYVRGGPSAAAVRPPQDGEPAAAQKRGDERRLALLDRIADIRRAALGRQHHSLARSLCDIAILRTMQDDFFDALRAIDEAIAIEARRPPDVRDALARLHEVRGLVLRAAERLDEGAAAHLEAYALRQQYPVRIPALMAHSLLMLGDVFLARGERDPAAEMYARAADCSPLEPWLRAATLEAQADLLRVEGQDGPAADLLALALKARAEEDEALPAGDRLQMQRLVAEGVNLLRTLSPAAGYQMQLDMRRNAADRCTRMLDEATQLTRRLGYTGSARTLYRSALETAHATHGRFHAHWLIAASRLAFYLRTLNRGGKADVLVAQQRLVALATLRRRVSRES